MFPLPALNVARIDALYAEIPEAHCKGLCQQACGPILATEVEWKRLLNHAGLTETPKLRDDLSCPFLDAAGRCSVYAVRPLVCRMWGAAADLPCPHGCRPAKMLGRAESQRVLHAVHRLGKIGRRLNILGTALQLGEAFAGG